MFVIKHWWSRIHAAGIRNAIAHELVRGTLIYKEIGTKKLIYIGPLEKTWGGYMSGGWSTH
mgnify:FL=1